MKNDRNRRIDRDKCILGAVYAVFAVFYFWLASRIPYTHDDWDWGLPVGLTQLMTASLNARYAGNFFVVIMTRSELVKTVVMGAGFFLLPYELATIADRLRGTSSSRRKCFDFLLCNVLLLSIDRWIWRQTYGWVAGFANFVLSGVFILGIVAVCLPVFGSQLTKKDRFSGKCIGLLFLGIVSQLFLENVAIYLFGLTLLTGFVHRKRTGAFSLRLVFLTVGTFLGLILVFSSSMYRGLWETGAAVGGYRQLFVNANADLGTFLLKTLRQAALLPYRVGENNLIISLCVSLLLGVNAWQYNGSRKALRGVFLLGNGGFVVYFLANHFFRIVDDPLLLSILNSLYLLLCGAEILLLIRKTNIFLAWASAVLVVLPVCVTLEIGPRLFLTANLFSVLLVLLLINGVAVKFPRWVQKSGLVCCVCAAMLLVACHGKIYYEIGKCKNQRDSLIAQAAGQEVVLPLYPYAEYLWHPEPDDETREVFFKEFYDISQEVQVIFEP